MVGQLIVDTHTMNTVVVRFVSHNLNRSLLQLILNEHQYKSADVSGLKDNYLAWHSLKND
jgi:hypothetical protein